jgi:hypothetical protein
LWELFEQLWTELGYADYLSALQRYRLERLGDAALRVSRRICQYPFGERLYPGAPGQSRRSGGARPS